MAKTNIRIDIPNNQPEKLLKLGEDVLTQNTADGANTKVDPADATGLTLAVTKAKEARDESIKLRKLSEEKMEEANNFLGIGKGQTKDTVGTVYYHLIGARDVLKTKFRGKEEGMSKYGFNVVKTTTGMGGSKKPKA